MLGKYAMYGIMIQCIGFTLLFASEGKAQKFKSVKDTYVQVGLENANLGEVIKRIESQTDYKFVYQNKLYRNKKNLKIALSNDQSSVADVLMVISKQSGLKFKQINNNININSSDDTEAIEIVLADVDISGKVSDENGEGLPGASVLIKGTASGTTTDLEGNYKLSVPENATLAVSYVGYINQEITLDARTTYDFDMKVDASQMEEIVVTALGIERDTRSLGYAATQVKGKDVVQANTINPVAALQGKAAGLSISGSDGGLFGSTKIEIRGVSSMNSQNNQPIFVIDGVILENATGSVGSHDWSANSNDFGNMLKNLNVDDYESINVLKGAAATALYGSRGIHGAIIIKSKDGAGVQGLGVTFSQSTSIDHVFGQPDFNYTKGPGNYYGNRTYTGDRYGQGFTTTTVDGQTVPTLIGGQGRLFGPEYDPSIMVQDYDGQMIPYAPVEDHFVKMYDLGIGSNTNIALRGGNENGNFYLSTGYNKRSGTTPNNDFKKTSIFLSGTRKLSDFLVVNSSISVTESESGNPPVNHGNSLITSLRWGPMYDADKWRQQDVYQAPHGGRPNNNLGDEYGNVPGNNIWFSTYMNENIRKETVVRPVIRVTANVTNWLQVVAAANVNFYNINSESKVLGQGYQNEGGSYNLGHRTDVAKTGKLSFIVDKETGDFSHNLLLHAETWNQRKTQSGGRTSGGLIVPGQYFIANSRNVPLLNTTNVYGTKEINSLLFKYSVGWRDQLYLDITGRNDWSSALTFTDGTGNNSYFYPSVSSSWVFSETFADNMPAWLTFGKLRASWAQVGNDTNPFAINNGYSTGNIDHANGNIITNRGSTTVVDPLLKPEQKTSFEIGTNVSFMQNRLNLDVAYYDDLIKNQISTIPLPGESGFNNLLTNVGALRNTGIELTLRADILKNNTYSWTSTFNYWRNTTTVEDLNELTGEFKNLYGSAGYGNYRVSAVAFEEGEYGVLYSDSKIGQNDAGQNLMSWHNGVKAPYYKRAGGREEVGRIQPSFEGSWNNEFTYKNFTLGVLLDMRFGGEVVSFPAKYGTAYGVLETSLNAGLTADENLIEKGVTWTSKRADGDVEYTNGVIPAGVFDNGTTITDPDGVNRDASGLTWKEAAAAGIVDDAVAEGQWAYWHSAWGTGVVNPNWLYTLSYISVRNISIGYNVKLPKLNIRNLNVSLNVRNAGYLHNSSPANLHPESGRGTGSSQSAFIRTLMPYQRTYTLGLQFTF
ncbi:MAG: iron complex outermembrane receptor protein [Cyclobacteriaceae bacterium]|jgi:iron complex outermembrane receptor protein